MSKKPTVAERLLNALATPQTFWSLFAFMSVGWVVRATLLYFGLDWRMWDTGLHLHPVANWVHNGQYVNDVMNVHPFANHFRPAMLIFAPFIALSPSLLWIIGAKLVAFLGSPLLILRFSKRYIADKRFHYVVPSLWLIHDVFITAISKFNEATTLAIPLILLAFFMAYEKRWGWMMANLVAVIFFKENMALIWVCIGMFLGVHHKNWKAGIGLILAGITIGLAIFGGIMPAFTADGQTVANGAFAPFSLMGLKTVMIIKLLLSFGFVHFLSPGTLLYTLPSVGVYLAGNRETPLWVSAHYHDYTVAVLFFGLWMVIKQVSEGKTPANNWRPNVTRRVALSIIFLIVLSDLGKLPHKDWFLFSDWGTRFRAYAELKQIKENIRENDTLFLPDNLAVYFIDHPNLNVVDKYDDPKKVFRNQSNRTLIMAKDEAHDYLTNEQRALYKSTLGGFEQKEPRFFHVYLIPAEKGQRITR